MKYKKKTNRVFYTLNKKEKNKIIFKENIDYYKYKLNENQIKIIDKINNIRYNKGLNKLEFKEEQELTDFILNKKTELVFYKNENIYKLSPYLYIFKYPKNTFQNFINNNKILNILTIDILNKIQIIEQNDIEFILIYDKNKINELNNITIKNFNLVYEIGTKDINNNDDKSKNVFIKIKNESQIIKYHKFKEKSNL